MKRLLTVVLAVASALAAFAVSPESKAADSKGAESVKQLFAALNSGRGGDLYELLPPSYKKDISTVVSAFGTKMDADLWKEGQGIVAELADLAAAKSGMMAELSPRMIGADLGMTPEQLAASKKETADIISKVAPEVKTFANKLTLDILKTGKIEDVLAMPELANIAKFVTNTKTAKEEFSLVDVKSGLDGAVIAVVKDRLGQIENTEFVNVEGSWIPKELADRWKEGVDTAINEINGMKFEETQKQQFLSMVPMVKMGIQQAKKAATPEELGQALMMPAMMIAMSMGSIGGASEAAEEAPAMPHPMIAPRAPRVTPRPAGPPPSVPSPIHPTRPTKSGGVNQMPGWGSRPAPQPVTP